MVDLIITDSNHVDVRSAVDFTLDCAWGKEENDFELVASGASTIDAGAYIYVDGSECGGVVDAMEDQLTAGVTVIGSLISRVGLDSVFDAVAPPDGSGDPTIKQYQFDRYADCYTGLQKMCEASGLKLRLAYASGRVNIWAEPVAHYGDSIDSDLIDFDVTRTWRKPNHLIGLGKGDLAARVVVHWYADAKGNVSQTQSLRGVDEITQVYDYSSAEANELNQKTREKLQELQSEGDVKVTVRDDANVVFDVGDTVTARDNLTGITVNATISKKIVKVSGGVMSVDYEAE